MTHKTITERYASLTKHPQGSLKELWHISFPLMLTLFSEYFMLFVDRVFLANYSTITMNAAVTAGMAVFTLQIGFNSISAIAQVFVGQYNGAKRFSEVGGPVWQMLYLSIASFVIFIPLSIYTGHIFLPEQLEAEGLSYFRWAMCFAPILPMITAVASFFIGRGEIKIIWIATVISNLINLILDIILIFGVEGLAPRLGATGAIIATIIASTINFLILFSRFLLPKYRIMFGTMKMKFNPKLMWECIYIGVPGAIGHTIAMAGWAALLHMLAWVSNAHVTIMAIGQTIFLVFGFFTDGVQKGVTTICANQIGAKQYQHVHNTLKSSFIMAVIFMSLMTIPFMLYPDFFINGFLAKNPDPNLHHLVETALIWIWVFVLFDCSTYILSGVLLAGADTKAIMILNALTTVFFAIAPMVYFVIIKHGPPIMIWQIYAMYALLSTIVFYLRYRSNAWQRVKLT